MRLHRNAETKGIPLSLGVQMQSRGTSEEKDAGQANASIGGHAHTRLRSPYA